MKKYGVLTAVIILLAAASVIAVGTYAWFGIAQNFTNEFTYDPYSIKLIKTDADTGELLQGTVFDLYEKDGTEPLGRYVTDKNGEILLHGETPVFENVDAAMYYKITEKNYFEIVYDDSIDWDDGFGCGDDGTPGHYRAIGTGSGWMTFADNSIGRIRADGCSAATFTNTKVSDDYEVTIASPVVVDRILANLDDIDPEKGFSVTTVIGDDPLQSFYYEVIHIEDTANVLSDYNGEYDYYSRNDPGVPEPPAPMRTAALLNTLRTLYPSQEQEVGLLSSPTQMLSVSIQAAAAFAEFPPPVSLTTGFRPPLHTPTNSERWKDQHGNTQGLSVSEGNTITIDLHHSSALIVYGIPTGTQYTVEQVDYRFIDGYMIDNTIKTQGTILLDLEVLPDEDTDDSMLLRVRADIYNYFVLPIMEIITLEKGWEHRDNPVGYWPAGTTIDVIDDDSFITFDSRTLIAISNWSDSVTVPKYDPVTGELIDYGVSEHLPLDYIITDIEETENSFVITNTYAPSSVKPLVMKRVKGSPLLPSDFRFI